MNARVDDRQIDGVAKLWRVPRVNANGKCFIEMCQGRGNDRCSDKCMVYVVQKNKYASRK